MTNPTNKGYGIQGVPFFSYSFRPFFLSAALFAGVAIPVWVLLLPGASHSMLLYVADYGHLFNGLMDILAGRTRGLRDSLASLSLLRHD